MARPWLVLREGERRRWGGDLRRRYLLDGLIERTGATALDGWPGPATLARALRGPRWQPWRRRALVASTEFLMADRLEVVTVLGEPVLVDVHDEPLIQAAALGIATPAAEATVLGERMRSNRAAFRFHVAPSAGFAELAGMDPARTLIAPNGCDTGHIVARPIGSEPVVGYASGAAPGRGIETLIEGARLARRDVPGLVLRLWLLATGEGSQAYLDALGTRVADAPWVEITSVAYADLSDALASARVMCVPHPADPYMDAVLPIKLFDSMASGRPVVVTPRPEMAAVVEAHEAGIVTSADTPEALAAALVPLLEDDALARRLGANARRAAETTYDWRVIGSRLADDLLARLA